MRARAAARRDRARERLAMFENTTHPTRKPHTHAHTGVAYTRVDAPARPCPLTSHSLTSSARTRAQRARGLRDVWLLAHVFFVHTVQFKRDRFDNDDRITTLSQR